MFNDFVIVGPREDPAGIRDIKDVSEALVQIAERENMFISRGDDSGTHKAELRIWRATAFDPASASGGWYKESGSDMGATFNLAAGLNAYTLTDHGTWLSFRNRGDLDIVLEGAPSLFNPYGVILVNPDRHPHIRVAEARRFIDWLTEPDGQATIATFRIADQQLFFPNTARP